MIFWFRVGTSQILLFVAVFLACGLAKAPLAQRLPKATGREPESKSATSRPVSRPKRQTVAAASRTPASEESGNLLDLGDRFRQQKKWNAAEAAYKEAVKAWPGNVDARLELGLLYLDRNKMDEAQQTYSELRPLNSSYASNLLGEINRRKSILAH